jgi:hypothetical protein
MAYKNLLNLTQSNPKDSFQRIRDFMCSRGVYASTGAGWTYHDSYYLISETSISNNDYFVMYSAGEDGQRDLYFKVLVKSGYIDIIGYLYWNNGTHAGVHAYGVASSWTNTDNTNNILWVFADLDKFFFITKYTPYYGATGGWMPDSSYSQTISVATGYTAPRTFTFASVPESWAIDTELFIRDTANIEKVTISNISGNDVTLASLVASYTTGAKFCLENTNYVQSQNNSLGNYNLQIDHNGTKNVSVVPDNPQVQTSGVDGLTKKYVAKMIYLASSTNLIGPIKDVLFTTSLASGSTHTIGSVNYTYFGLYNGAYFMIKTVAEGI